MRQTQRKVPHGKVQTFSEFAIHKKSEYHMQHHFPKTNHTADSMSANPVLVCRHFLLFVIAVNAPVAFGFLMFPPLNKYFYTLTLVTV